MSVGGNDIALRPSCATIVNMLLLMKLTSTEAIAQHRGIFLGHFVKLFGQRVKEFCMNLIAKRKPKKIIVCMIYHPGACVRDAMLGLGLGLHDTLPGCVRGTVLGPGLGLGLHLRLVECSLQG